MQKHHLTFEQLPGYVYELGQKVDQLIDRLNNPNIPRPTTDEILTIQQAAQFLNLTTQTIYGLVSARKIPFSKPTGSRLYFSRLELIEWLKSNRTATVQEQAQQYEQGRITNTQRRGGRKTA